MNENNEWDNLFEMFEDIREHAKNNGRSVISEDHPQKLKLGWRCTKTNKIWLIRLLNVKHSLLEADQEKYQLIKKLLQTSAGKTKLTESLNSKDL